MRKVSIVLHGDSDERASRRPFDLAVAGELLEALGVRGVAKVKQCWVDEAPGFPTRQAVCVMTKSTWRAGDEDTGVPVEQVYFLRHRDGGWCLDGVARVLPNEPGLVFERDGSPKRKPANFLEDQAYRAAVEAAGNARGVMPAYSKESAEWHGMHVERGRAAGAQLHATSV